MESARAASLSVACVRGSEPFRDFGADLLEASFYAPDCCVKGSGVPGV